MIPARSWQHRCFHNISFDEIEASASAAARPASTAPTGFDAITIKSPAFFDHPGPMAFATSPYRQRQPRVPFIDVATLVINALGGSDEIALRHPAPNNADWDVDVTINGGSPADGMS